MTCPLCGDICRCSTNAHSDDAQPAAAPRWLPNLDATPADVPTIPLTGELRLETAIPHEETEVAVDGQISAPEDSPAWRQEVAARLNRYQSRRKPRPPRYPSLSLRFEDEENTHTSNSSSLECAAFSQTSQHALALDEFEFAERTAPTPPVIVPPPPVTTGKIIEFPRSWTPPAPPPDELAEPVVVRPRILEAPEVVPPPPALGGITIEPAQQPELEKRPGIDIPLQSAPLSRRILSAAVDDAIIAVACVLFGFIFWKITAIQPPRLQIIGLAAGLSVALWAAYQYLLVVYAGTTPGLRLAGLQLARFNGSTAPRSLRRWRVLASFLSAASLGMGYAWVFLDEDALCWHDRITHTYLAPKNVKRRS